jgi:hypothetical protein
MSAEVFAWLLAGIGSLVGVAGTVWALVTRRARARDLADSERVGRLEAVERDRLRAVIALGREREVVAAHEAAGIASATAAERAHTTGTVTPGELDAIVESWRKAGGR